MAEAVTGRSPRLIPSAEVPMHYTDGRGTHHALIPGDKWTHHMTGEVLAVWLLEAAVDEGTWELTEAGNKHLRSIKPPLAE